MLKQIKKTTSLFLVGATIYFVIEVLFRGYSHWTMLLLGGLCFLLIGYINERYHHISLLKQGLVGSGIITILEFVFGIIFNIVLKWNIWDYSDVPFNILGQICIPFSIAWIGLSVVAVFVDDYLRYIWFDESRPIYKWL